MSLFIEFHLIQNFAPSNLNRDDTGAPKDAVFGGHRRARISSQCFKRAVRLHAKAHDLVPTEAGSVRTKKLGLLLKEKLAHRGEDVLPRARIALSAAGLEMDEQGITQYLLFLGRREIDAFAALIDQHWDELIPPAAADEKGKKSKKEAKASAPEALKNAARVLDGGKAVDVALFGRMLADLPQANQDAACQVAHALSTHRVEREFDYFTAVDDEGTAEETGAGMLGQVEFTSATFYRYAVLDAAKLLDNLGDDKDLALVAVRAFIEAFVRAIPTGKQNTFAAHNPPSFIGVSLRHGGPVNLANAFEKPVFARHDVALTTQSVAALAAQARRLDAVYGDTRDAWRVIDLTDGWNGPDAERVTGLSALVDWVSDAVRANQGA